MQDWQQWAELHKTPGGMAIAPDPPIWQAPGKVTSGTLTEMLVAWRDLPPSHQASHVIHIHNDVLQPAMIRDLIEQPEMPG